MKGEFYEGVHKREKWVKYLMQHLCKKKPNPAELKSLIHWTERTSIKPKQTWKLLKIHHGKLQISWIINFKKKQKQRRQSEEKLFAMLTRRTNKKSKT